MIDINWSTLLLQIVNFLVMVAILTKFFFKPVVKILDERSKKVTSALEEAERREREAAAMRAEYEDRLVKVQEKVIAMRQQAQDEIERTRRQMMAETQEELRALREKTAHELEEMRRQAMLRHRRELGELVVQLSGRLMREAGGEALQRASVERFIEQLAALPPEQYSHVLADEEVESVLVHLTSAGELEPETISEIEKLIVDMVHRPVEIKHAINPALIAGATVRFGDLLADGSLAGQLKKLCDRYLAEVEGEWRASLL